MIKMSTSREWLLKKAGAEDAGDVSVGGLACQVGLIKSDRTHVTERTAFAKLVELRRRDCGLALEQLADKADVDLEEMVGIERGQELPSEPRTVHQIATILRLSPNRLMELAGFVERRDHR